MSKKYISYLFIYLIVTFALGGVEVIARNAPHDDGFFLLKSIDFKNESYMYGLKEVGYPIFLKLCRFLSLNLITFQCFIYTAFCILLFEELYRYWIGFWGAMVLVTVFAINPLGSVIAQYLTSDVLQYLLVPITIYSLLRYSRERVASTEYIAAAVLIAHYLTRPDWMVFLVPYFILSIFLIIYKIESFFNICKSFVRVGIAFIISIMMLFSFNYLKYGFFSKTLVSSSSVNNVVKDLMMISGVTSDRYSPISKIAYYKAFEISPEFGLLKGYYEKNLDGNGWSKSWVSNYSTKDGSIDGGHHNFALIDAVASIKGGESKVIIASLDVMHNEFKKSDLFQNHANESKGLISIKLGPNFVFDEKLYDSIVNIGKLIADPLRQSYILSQKGDEPSISVLYDKYLKRTSFSNSDAEVNIFEGWIINTKNGGPSEFVISKNHACSGVKIESVSRNDLNVFIQKPADGFNNKRGFVIKYSDRNNECFIKVMFGTEVVNVKIDELNRMGSDRKFEGFWLHKDESVFVDNRNFKKSRDLLLYCFPYVFYALYIAILISLILILAKKLIIEINDIIITISLTSSVIAKLTILAAIDSSMFPGNEVRYYAPVVPLLLFSMAFFLTRTKLSKG